MGIYVAADLDGRRDADGIGLGCLPERGRQRAGAILAGVRRYQRAIPGLMDAVWSREMAAGVEPAHRNGKAATLTGGLAHEVSILLGVGRQLGWQAGANTSMTIMCAPQRGHGQGTTRGASGANPAGFGGSAAGGATLRSARAVAMLSARLAEAKSP